MKKKSKKDRKDRTNVGLNNKKKSSIVVIAIAAIVLIAGFGLGGYYILDPRQSTDNENANNINTSSLAPSSNNLILPSTGDGSVVNESRIVSEGTQGGIQNDPQFFCGNLTQGASYYINEYEIPISCSQPLGLASDNDNNIWIASGWSGNLFVFDPQTKSFVKNISMPNWPQPQQGKFGSMIWDMKFDENGDLWFTDQKSNSIWKYFTQEDRFENYRLLAEGGYPLSLVFDSDNKVWFTQVFGNRLGVLDPSQAESNTTNGISELDMSAQLQFQTMGPISKGFEPILSNNDSTTINTQNETLWFSTVTYPVGGQLIKYDIGKESLTIHDLTYTQSVPISVAEDENGTVWTNDHAANIFLSLDPDTGSTKQYATSNSSTASKSTLPYYNEYRDGKIWFNEHYGNAIAYYDIANRTLVEYIIPSINPLWGNGSNPLKFTFDNEGSVWFTEWTENKLGVIPNEKINQLPISIATSKDKMVIDTKTGEGDSLDIFVSNNNINFTEDKTSNGNTSLPSLSSLPSSLSSSSSLPISPSNSTVYSIPITTNVEFGNKPANVTMFVTSSMSKLGELRNLTSSFSEKMFVIDDSVTDVDVDVDTISTTVVNSTSGPTQPYITTLEINPTIEMEPGNYTLTISARYNNDITISKIIDLEIL